MRLAILSDIHGNLPALEAVWADLQGNKPDLVYCLGDLVGYGAQPNDVIDFIRRQAVPTIMGNYDEGVGFDMDDCGCVYRHPVEADLGQQSLVWTRQQTSAANKAFLRELPLQLRLEDQRPSLLLVHGSPRKINEYLYEDRPQASFERIAKLAGSGILLFGHTHLPYVKQVSGTWFVNAGSVGKPKDGDWRAGYLLVDLGLRPSFSYHRVRYDVAAAAHAIRASQLPPAFASQLETGRGPNETELAQLAGSLQARRRQL